jgi:rhomboid-like protein
MQHIEREESAMEKEHQAELMRRAEKLGLYKPQRDTYSAKLGEKGDMFGKSKPEKLCAANEAKAARNEEMKKEIEQGLAQLRKINEGQYRSTRTSLVR